MRGRSPLRRAGIFLAVLGLGACATPPKLSAPTEASPLLVCEPMLVKSRACAEAIAALDARAAVMRAATPGLTATGRAAVRQGRDGGTVGFEWTALGGDDFGLTLTAPMGLGRWQLTQKGAQATLAGMGDGLRTGPDAAALANLATGFDLPIRQMGAWLRGVPDAATPATRLAFDGERLTELTQAGWDLRFDRFDAQQRPLLIEAKKDAASVRLLITGWSASAP